MDTPHDTTRWRRFRIFAQALGVIFLACSLLPLAVTLFLFNQEIAQIIPFNFFVYDVYVGDANISTMGLLVAAAVVTVTLWTLGVCLILVKVDMMDGPVLHAIKVLVSRRTLTED